MALPAFMIAALVAASPAPHQTPATPPQAATTEASNADAYFFFLQGHMLEGSGDVPGAIEAYQKAIAAAPNAADIKAELAGVYARAGRANEAVSSALDALKVDSKNFEAHRILGLVQAAMADNTTDRSRQSNLQSEAITHLEQALAGGSHDLSAEWTLGRLYVTTGEYDKGAAALRVFLNDRPGYPDAVMMLADALEATHHSGDAIGIVQDYIRDEPDDLKARVRLAELDESVGRWQDAADAWAFLAKRSGASVQLRLRYASALVNSGDLSGSRDVVAGVNRDSPRDISAWYLASQIALRAGDATGAETAAKKIEEIDPKDPRGPLALADARVLQKDYAGAAAIMEPLVTSSGDADIVSGLYTRYVVDLAGIYQSSGDHEKSVKTLEAARTRVPDDTTIALTLAAAYDRSKHLDQAESVYRDLLKKDPTNAEAMNDLGYMLAEHDRKLDEAIDLIKRALASESDNPSYLDSLGWAYVKQNKADLARDPLERAASAEPRSSVIQNHLAEAYFKLKRYADAASTWDRALAGDRRDIDIAAVTEKRDKARQLAK